MASTIFAVHFAVLAVGAGRGASTAQSRSQPQPNEGNLTYFQSPG
jgi:hypothetical protein